MMQHWNHLRIDDSNREWFTLWMDVKDRKLNVLSSQLFHELQDATRWFQKQSHPFPIVLRSAKERGFVVGADLREILEVKSDAQIQQFLSLGQEVLGAWEQLTNPTVAWIRGACLGGGLELAMACRYRLVCDSEDTQLGMPESKLGLTPGWGGTQRLPRLVGVREAMSMLLSGDSIASSRACEIGLADGTWSPENIELEIAAWVARLTDHKATRRSPMPSAEELKHEWSVWAKIPSVLVDSIINDADVTYAARQAILRAVEQGINVSVTEGMRIEREGFYLLLNRPEVQMQLQRFAPRKP